MRRHVIAGASLSREMNTRLFFHSSDMGLQPLPGFIVNHRPDMGGQLARVADRKFARGACDHLDHAIGDIVLHEQQP